MLIAPFTFEAPNLLHTILGAVHSGTVLRLNVGRVEALEPFATLEWHRRVGCVADIAIDCRRYLILI